MLTVSIVTYRTDCAELHRCVSSLKGCGVACLYIVDNYGDDAIRRFCAEHGAEYIPLPNPGFGAAHNAAIRRARQLGSTIHLVLNSDVYFNPEELNKMTAFMESHPDVGAMHPRVLNPDGTPQYTARLLPTPWDVFGRRFLPASWFRARNDRYLIRHAPLDSVLDVPYFQGSFMLLNMNTLDRVGMFDERFFMYPEDIDLTRRLHAVSPTLLWPQAGVVHDHRQASYRSWRMLRIHIVNMCRYFCKWGWWRDPERRRMNRRLLHEINEINRRNQG